MVAIGQEIPDFNLPVNGGKTLSKGDLIGQFAVIYFYPKDNTSGCTAEGIDFRDAIAEFRKHNAQIIGVSRDSVKSHDNFAAKYGFPFALISDGEETLCKIFDVIQEKSMYGRKYMGVERSTFLIGPDGVLLKEWRKVKVKNHVAEVLAALEAHAK